MDDGQDFRTELVRDLIERLYELGEVDTPPDECTIEWEDTVWKRNLETNQESDDGR